MSTDLLTKEDTKLKTDHTDSGDHERFAHYFKKQDIEAAYFDGKEVKALCGKKDRPIRDFTKFPVCPTCQEIFNSLKE